jgi:hypothetical protein
MTRVPVLSLFDERDLAEIESPQLFSGERLIVCKNHALAEERRRKRGELLDATEQDLKDIQVRILRKRKPLRGADKIGLAVGAVIGRRKVGKHFRIAITDGSLSFTRDHAAIAKEAALDGFYVLRTNVPADAINTADTVRALQKPGACRARLSQLQDHRPRHSSDLPLDQPTRARPRVPVHAP